jgi:hypothetical protein
LPEGSTLLAVAFKEISSADSTESVSERLLLLFGLDPGHLKLSLDE